MSLTILICIITGGVSYIAFSNPALQERLTFIPYLIKRDNEWYRFISHGFVHGSMGHLLINIFVLFQFGEFTDRLFQVYFGQNISGTLLIVFYFSAIIVSSIYSYLKHQDNSSYRAVGASGGTSAIITGYVIYDPWKWFVFPPIPAIFMLVAYLWYSNDMAKKGRDNIGHDAHFYGMVYGVAFIVCCSLILNPELLTDFMARFMEGPRMPGLLQGF